jgi:glycosyltransferase involved in cell wall biosynthesis
VIWLDVSTLLASDGPKLPQERLQRNLAKWAFSNGSGHFRYCRLNERHRSIVGVPERLVACMAAGQHFDGCDDGQRLPSRASGKWDAIRHRFPRASLATFKARSQKLGANLATVARLPALRKRLSRFVAIAGHGEIAQHTAQAAHVPFANHDVYFISDLDWRRCDLSFLYQLKKRIGFKLAVLCCDTLPLTFPQLCPEDIADAVPRQVTDLAWSSDLMIFVSEATEQRLQTFIRSVGAPVPVSRRVAPDAEFDDSSRSGRDDSAADHYADTPFVLCVCPIERSHNHEVLYRAWCRLIDEGFHVPNLACVGNRRWGADDLLDLVSRDPRTKGRIRLFSQVSESALCRLYDKCLFSVYPSRSRDWPIFVAQSVNRGKLCLAADSACVREVGGDLLEYIDVDDVLRWADRVRYYAENLQSLNRRNEIIRDTYRPRSWQAASQDIAAHLLDLYVGVGPKC